MFDVRNISFKNMLLTALVKWRLIILTALVFAVVTPAIMYKLDERIAPESEVPAVSSTGTDLKTEALSKEAIESDISTLADLFIRYDQIDKQLQHNGELGLDPNNMKYAYVQYHLEIPEKSAGYLHTIQTSYSLFVKDDIFVDGIADIADFGIDPVLFGKNTEVVFEDMDMIVNVPCRESINSEQLLTQIKEYIDLERTEISKIADHTLTFVGQGFTNRKNSDLTDEQAVLTSDKNSVNNQIQSVLQDLSQEQIEYAHKIAEGAVSKESISEFIDGRMMEMPADTSSASHGFGFVIKFAVAGGVLGTILAIFVLCLGYAISDRLHSAKELSKQADMPCLGTVRLPARKRVGDRIDVLIKDNLCDSGKGTDVKQQLEFVVASVTLHIKKLRVNSLCLVSSCQGDNDSIIESLVDLIGEQGTDVQFVKDVVHNIESLRKCVDSNGLILVEQIGVSRLTDIENTIITVRRLGIDVIGSIILE